MEQIDGTIRPVRPFDFSHTLRFVKSFRPCSDEQHIAGANLTKAVTVGGRPVVFTTHPATETSLHYIVHAREPINPCLQLLVQDRIRFYLGCDDELAAFYEIADRDPDFAPVARSLRGFHHVKFMTPFENAVWAVMGQAVPLAISRAMKRRFVERFGSKLRLGAHEYWAFPDAKTIAALEQRELAEVIHLERKARAVRAVAAAFSDADEAFLRTGPYDDVYDWLRAIDGIGEWPAAFIMLRGLGRMERVQPHESLLAAAAHVYRRSIDAPRFAELAERYGPWQGYWAFYLRNAELKAAA